MEKPQSTAVRHKAIRIKKLCRNILRINHFRYSSTVFFLENSQVQAEVEVGNFTPRENIKIMPYSKPIIKYSSRELFSDN
jgi:hypothetical protein